MRAHFVALWSLSGDKAFSRKAVEPDNVACAARFGLGVGLKDPMSIIASQAIRSAFAPTHAASSVPYVTDVQSPPQAPRRLP